MLVEGYGFINSGFIERRARAVRYILGTHALQFEEYWIFNVSANLSSLSSYRTDENTFSVFSTSNVIFLS